MIATIAMALALQAPTPVAADSFGDPTELYIGSPSASTTIPSNCLTWRNQIIINIGWLTADTDSYSVTIFIQWHEDGCVDVGPGVVAFGLQERVPTPDLNLLIEPLIVLPIPFHPNLYGWGWSAYQLPVIMPGPIDHVLQAAAIISDEVIFTQGVRVTF